MSNSQAQARDPSTLASLHPTQPRRVSHVEASLAGDAPVVAASDSVRAWAQRPDVMWDHPLKAIKDELLVKTSGRVLQTDTDLAKVKKPAQISQATWDAFLARTTEDRLWLSRQPRPGPRPL